MDPAPQPPDRNLAMDLARATEAANRNAAANRILCLTIHKPPYVFYKRKRERDGNLAGNPVDGFRQFLRPVLLAPRNRRRGGRILFTHSDE